MMKRSDIIRIAEAYKQGNISEDELVDKFDSAKIDDLGFARIDNHREDRTGIPEVII